MNRNKLVLKNVPPNLIDIDKDKGKGSVPKDVSTKLEIGKTTTSQEKRV